MNKNFIMKIFNKISLPLIFILILGAGCSDMLNEPVHSQLAPENFVNTPSGIETILAESYSKAANISGFQSQHSIKREEMVTDILFHSGGGEHSTASLLLNFTWDASSNVGSAFMWGAYWDGIRNTNIVLDNVDRVDEYSEAEKERIKAEARFVRVQCYYILWNQFGTVPLRTSTEDALELPRASEEEFFSFMESELQAVIPVLPEPGNEPNYGRAHSGAARALLTKWYLNTRQWQKSANMAQEIISNGHFELYPDYNEMFALENEQNNEFIWVKPALANEGDAQNSTTATAFPQGFQESVDYKFPITFEGWANFASQYRLYDEFVNSFAPNDERDDRILKRYVNTQGDTVDLMQDFDNAARGLKYPPDPGATGPGHGNDIPFIRYADILLARAEALNEINGPNQESINLINDIRNRAGLENVSLGGFGSTEELREHILKERKWEFWYENKRRRDLIRMRKFIEFAHQRGLSNADEHHRWFPIPQSAIDANPQLKQNTDY
jgi:hypothetical protein